MNPLVLNARVHLRIARLHLMASAIALVFATELAATSPWLRPWAIAGMAIAVANLVWSMRRVFTYGKRVMAAVQLACALQVGTEADIEIAWMNLLYLEDPAFLDEPVNQQSAFRELRRDRPRFARVLRLGHR